MRESKNMLENNILKYLSLHDALGEVKLYEMVKESDTKDDYIKYRRALINLQDKGVIEVANDMLEMMQVISLKRVLH